MNTRKFTSIFTAACLGFSLLGFAPTRFADSRKRETSQHKSDDSAYFDPNSIQKPIVGRVIIGADRLRSATVHVPSGTRAYLAGRLDDSKPAVLAWYNSQTSRLVAAVEIRVDRSAAATSDGVEINAGANEKGLAAALVTIKSRQHAPALLRPEGAVTLQAAGDSRQFQVAPLLSFEGSSHLVSLTQPIATDILQTRQFDVRVKNARGETVFNQKELAADGDAPVKVQIGTTTPDKPSRLEVINSGSMNKLVSLKPETANVRWWPEMTHETRTIAVGAGETVSPGSLVSNIPGRFPFSYGERTVSPSNSGISRVGDWSEGPVIVDENGSATIGGLSNSPVTGVATDRPNTDKPFLMPVEDLFSISGRGSVLPGASNSTTRQSQPRGPSRFAVGLTGLAGAGAMAVLLSNDRGEKREEVVSFVPVSSDALDNQPSTVEIIPMPETGSLIGYGDLPQDAPCDCKCTVTYDAQPAITNVTIQTSKGLEDIEPGGWDKPQLTKEQRDRLTKSAGEISGWIRVTYQLAGASITTAGKGKGIVVARHTSVGIATAQSAWQILYRRGDLLGYTSSGPDEVQKMKVNCPGEARFDSKSYEVFIALIDSPNNIELRIGDEITATGGCTGCAGGSGETKWTVPLEWEKGKLKGVGKVEEIKPKEK